MMSSAVSADAVPDAVNVWLRPTTGGCEVKVDGKDEAIQLRQRLVRFGVHCTFPIPTWKRSEYVLHVTYTDGIGCSEVERVIAGLDGYRIVGTRT